jgi:DNA-binding response OmpR family regulator
LIVVVADKDPIELAGMRGALESPETQVFTATDGPVVVRLTQQHEPHAVVVGASLGRMGGFAVSRELKTMSELGQITEPWVVVLIEREADAWLAAWSRCDAWLQKPVDPIDVANLVREKVTPSATK